MLYTAMRNHHGIYFIQREDGLQIQFATYDPHFEEALLAGLQPLVVLPEPITEVTKQQFLQWFANHGITEQALKDAITVYVEDPQQAAELCQMLDEAVTISLGTSLTGIIRAAYNYDYEYMDTLFIEASQL